MTRTKLKLIAHPSGGVRAEVLMRGLRPGERMQVAVALFWALLTGQFRLEIPHAAASVRGQISKNELD